MILLQQGHQYIINNFGFGSTHIVGLQDWEYIYNNFDYSPN
jgi:hypothetical protein